jgi:TetR/AcrR family transcriptional repressor of nem operon
LARTKEFDEDEVLLKAMRLFWKQGNEKTSMMDLVTHMGVHKRSMYDSFGDKHSLYIKALKRYIGMVEKSVERIMDGTRSAEEAIRLWLELAIMPKEEELPNGCLLVNTAVELSPHDSESRAYVNQVFAHSEQFIRKLIETGQQSGEIDKTLEAEWLSYYFINAFTGLRVTAKMTDDREKINRIIETTMLVLKKR